MYRGCIAAFTPEICRILLTSVPPINSIQMALGRMEAAGLGNDSPKSTLPSSPPPALWAMPPGTAEDSSYAQPLTELWCDGGAANTACPLLSLFVEVVTPAQQRMFRKHTQRGNRKVKTNKSWPHCSQNEDS